MFNVSFSLRLGTLSACYSCRLGLVVGLVVAGALVMVARSNTAEAAGHLTLVVADDAIQDLVAGEMTTTVYATYWTTVYSGPQLRIRMQLVRLNCRYVKAVGVSAYSVLRITSFLAGSAQGCLWMLCVLRIAYRVLAGSAQRCLWTPCVLRTRIAYFAVGGVDHSLPTAYCVFVLRMEALCRPAYCVLRMRIAYRPV